MNRVRPMPILIVVTLLAGLQHSAQAGMVLYQQCVTSRGDKSDGFKATLAAGGLFYSWAGYSVKEPVGVGCLPNTPAVPDMFKGKNAAGTNSITEPLAKTIALDGHLLFYSIRNDTALDEDPMKTTLTLTGNPIGTKIGAALTSAKNDPVIDIFNGGSSTITLLSMLAQLNNSMDPLNPDLFFVPDGTPIFISPTLLPANMNILPGQFAEFMFPLNNSPNWSFTYSYMYLGDTYTDLLASDVPEPSTWMLLGFGLAGLAAWRKTRCFLPMRA